jgi:FkbM family methyltransferase
MKKLIKKIIRNFGWDLHRLNPASNSFAQLSAVLNHAQVNVVFDIGANVGQFAQELRSVGFAEQIISFEPLTSAHTQLKRAAKSDPNWLIHSRAAVGDRDGEIDINISGNSVSSSVLTMLDSHSFASEGSAYVGVERTSLVRLDSVAQHYLKAESRLFIKIDTQGFEWEVLDGAVEAIKSAHGVLLELSLTPLYDGQRLWREIIDRMEQDGFKVWAIQRGFTDSRTGQSLQIDAIFLRESAN